MENKDFELYSNDRCKRAVAELSAQLRLFINETQMHCERARTLGKIMADRKTLVCIDLLAETNETQFTPGS